MSQLGRVSMLALLASTFALSATASQAQPTSHARLVWSANQETGNLSQWIDGSGGGGPFNSGSGHVAISTAIAHSGKYSLALTIHDANGHHGSQAVRMFRWRTASGKPLPTRGVYQAWYYFPRVVRAPDWWNIMQWKTRLGTNNVMPTYIVNVGNDSSGAMVLYLWDAIHAKTVATSKLRIIPKQWMHLTVKYHWSLGNQGSIVVFQDGNKVLAAENVQTQLPSSADAPRNWSVNNYAENIQPSRVTIYVDDASIEAGT